MAWVRDVHDLSNLVRKRSVEEAESDVFDRREIRRKPREARESRFGRYSAERGNERSGESERRSNHEARRRQDDWDDGGRSNPVRLPEGRREAAFNRGARRMSTSVYDVAEPVYPTSHELTLERETSDEAADSEDKWLLLEEKRLWTSLAKTILDLVLVLVLGGVFLIGLKIVATMVLQLASM
jgi:hypothetical protein